MIHLWKQSTSVIAIILLLVVQAAYGYPELPAFNTPAKEQHFPGKLIWMDLLTDDVGKASAFYEGMFGWEAEVLEWEDKTYAIMSMNGRPLAGIFHREEAENNDFHGSWIPYLSVANLDDTINIASEMGGQILMDADLPDRGRQAIYVDNQGALVGFMESSTGDPDDFLAEYGEFLWKQLWVDDIPSAMEFYNKTTGLEELADESYANVYSHLLVSGATFRGSVMELPEGFKAKPGWLAFVRVENVDNAVAKAKELGGSLYVEPDEDVVKGRMAIIKDVMGAGIVVLEYEVEEGGE